MFWQAHYGCLLQEQWIEVTAKQQQQGTMASQATHHLLYLFIEVQSIVDCLGNVYCHFGSRGEVPCSVATRVLPKGRWGLDNNENLLNILVIHFVF